MNSEIIIYMIPFIIGGLVGLVLGIKEFIEVYNSMHSSKYIHIPGTVEVNRIRNNRRIAMVYAIFEYKESHIIKQIVLQSGTVKYESGDRITVCYNPESRKNKVRIEEENSLLKASAIVLFGFLIIIGALFVVFFFESFL